MASAVGRRFYPRCSQHMDVCARTLPAMVEVEEGHEVACHLYQ